MRRFALIMLFVFPILGQAGPSLTIQESEYGDRWPFTVSSATLTCREPGAVLMKTPDGKTYGVNGLALSHFVNFPDSRKIQKPGAVAGDVMGLPDDFIDRGMALCKK